MDLTVSLPDELASYIKRKIESGGYSSSSDVVSEALRLLEERDSANTREAERLRIAWHVGMESGDFAPLDIDAVKAEGRRRFAASKA
ncbi:MULTISPECIES: type II toxin-antitoxin system ParD family antitoxin [Rhizobium]|uniref:Type II toxin-antitoxin system ParD family antitoxin n=1 Tax=Rhizobium sophoriradicis TaxID=1535245 RepID=A0A2A5KXV2_9HYPH|nr:MULTISPECIES: type II toxin-antitoxin system ParD family antitoxin [Rhizobium]ARQ59424.1 addiction module antidote protein [Rhizobium sp. Kim5]PCK81914.1 type II toxin-antitoxin system ParD family antitoxin [Rhizobium sophoriradicis]RSB92632.1 type II toxin-antitoxin system ParD family antitoxin [Rhizobium sophoriradicis]